MAESAAKISDSTPEVEPKVGSAPDAVVEPTPSPTPVAEEAKVEEAKVEAPERKSFIILCFRHSMGQNRRRFVARDLAFVRGFNF